MHCTINNVMLSLTRCMEVSNLYEVFNVTLLDPASHTRNNNCPNFSKRPGIGKENSLNITKVESNIMSTLYFVSIQL